MFIDKIKLNSLVPLPLSLPLTFVALRAPAARLAFAGAGDVVARLAGAAVAATLAVATEPAAGAR